MDESIQEAEVSGLDLGRWLGRREAFGLIAGRCSAAEIESLRRIREEKHYRLAARSWNEFCTRYLKVSRRSVDRAIGYLQQFGPAFFHISQLARIGPLDYQAIAAHVSEAGLRVDGGDVIALLPENSQKLADAVRELLRQAEANEARPAAEPFEAALKRCRALTEMLAGIPGALDDQQKARLAEALREIRTTAMTLGVI